MDLLKRTLGVVLFLGGAAIVVLPLTQPDTTPTRLLLDNIGYYVAALAVMLAGTALLLSAERE